MSRVPGLSDHLVDDAAVFPPGNATIDAALTAHAGWHDSRYESLVGPLLLPAQAVPALRAAADPQVLIRLGLVADTGLTDLITARDALQDDGWFSVEQVEIALPPDSDPRRAAQALLDDLPFTAPTYIELPFDVDPDPVLAVLAADGAERAKLRCGPTLVPTAEQLARFLGSCVCHGVAFKLTAGLHHALPGIDPVSGVHQHGFLNTLAATWAAIDGAGIDTLIGLLAENDPDAVLTVLDAADVPRLRALYRSFGSCSITEPYDELTALSLIREEAP